MFDDRQTRAFYLLLAASTAARLGVALALPLTGDEAYIWEWARHPALSYYDHPGLTAWLVWLCTALFGDTVLGVRLTGVAAMTVSLLLLHRLAAKLAPSPRAAAQAAMLAMGLPLLAAGGVLLTTDAPLLLAGVAGALFFLAAIAKGRLLDWAGVGACWAAAFLSKFLGLFLPIGCFAFLALAPGARRHLKTPGPWLALAILGAGTLPVWAWNATHGWATFAFNLSARQAPAAFSLATLADYLAGQAVALSPLVFLFAFPALFAALPRRERPLDMAGLPALFAAVPYGGFLALSLVKKVGIHWPGVGAPFLALAVALGLARKNRERALRALLGTAWALTGLLLLAPLLLMAFPRALPPDWKYPLRPEKINSAELGKAWMDPALPRAVRAEADRLAGEGPPAFLFTRSYGLSSLVAFYTPGQPAVQVLGPGSSHGQNHRFWFDPALHRGENALFLSSNLPEHEEGFLRERFERWEAVVLPPAPAGSRATSLIRCFGYRGVR